MNVYEMHQSNRAAWNEAAAHYAEERDERVEFLRQGGTNFSASLPVEGYNAIKPRSELKGV